MKICFWSHIRGQAGVTTNMACVAAIIALGNKGRSVLLENHYNLNGIGEMAMPQHTVQMLNETGEYYNKIGIEYLIKKIYSGEKSEKLVHSTMIPLLFSTLFYLPQGKVVNKEVFNYEFDLVYDKLFFALENISEYVFIDTESNRNLSSKRIIDEADLVVVNLTQDPKGLKEFFEKNKILREKAIYIIGNYRRQYSFNLQYLCKKYKIPKERIGIVPYNIELEDAIKSGSILQFLNRNYSKPTSLENEYLIRNIKRTGQMIRKNALKISKEKYRGRLAAAK